MIVHDNNVVVFVDVVPGTLLIWWCIVIYVGPGTLFKKMVLGTIGFIVVHTDDAFTGMEVGYFIVVFLRLDNVVIMLNS